LISVAQGYSNAPKGGHAFGMKKQNLPVDNWTERFTDWLTMNGWLDKKK
jgi:hypothetical protein